MLSWLLVFVLSVQCIQFTFQNAEQRLVHEDSGRLKDPYSPGNWIEYIPADRPPLPKPDPRKPPVYRKAKNVTLDVSRHPVLVHDNQLCLEDGIQRSKLLTKDDSLQNAPFTQMGVS